MRRLGGGFCRQWAQAGWLMSRGTPSLREGSAAVSSRASIVTVADFATIDPDRVSGAHPGTVSNLVDGRWTGTRTQETIVDPLNGEPFLHVPSTEADELQPFLRALQACPKSGLHNPFKAPERYLLYGDVCAAAAAALKEPETSRFFARHIQRVSPKSAPQAAAEVRVTQKFLENYGGDQVRMLARSFGVPGDHAGQLSHGYRWPYGAVAIISPFNFPLEIPGLQLMGALFMGNKPVLKVDSKVAVVMEQFLRLLHACGAPAEDVSFINSSGPVMQELLLKAQPRLTQFTGSKRVAESLAHDLGGRVRLEDAGFDWKILGPDVQQLDYVAWVCDQDAYACSGQKCSAQSLLFMHEAWVAAGVEAKLAAQAQRRTLEDLSIGPVLTVSTSAMLAHVARLLEIPGARLAFGGRALQGHRIPERYGALEPTAVFVPLREMLKEGHFEAATREVFGPLQVLTEYSSADLPLVLEACERMEAHLTAAVVTSDPVFLQEVLGSTVNGTTYAGLRARTTGAPQNHWFGPAGDPRAAGIGTREAIQAVWSCHREVIMDVGPIPKGWALPAPT